MKFFRNMCSKKRQALKTFAYNECSEVVSTLGTNEYTYSYDPIGNRTASTQNAEAKSYISNPLNQYIAIQQEEQTAAPTYDADGNMLSSPSGWSFTWNAENRLVSASRGGAVVSYTYDAFGRMISKQIISAENKTITYTWDMFNIIKETENSNATYNIWGLDIDGTMKGAGGVGGLLAVAKSGNFYTPTYDANGNITEYVSDNGNIVAQYKYSAFGEIISQSGESFTHRFSTKPYCTTIGLIEYQFRKYDPALGRWLSRDPIEEDGGINLYAFCWNDGIVYYDVLGSAFVVKDEPRKYSKGFNGMPKIVFDNDFPYDENLKPTTRDYFNYLKWNVLVNGAVSLCYIEDATEMYSHYVDGSGTPLQFDYVKAYNEDRGIYITINAVIAEATNAAESLAKDNISVFYMSSTAKVNEVYPQTQNWQKTIGWHYIWGEAYVRKCNDSYKMLLTINAIDKYNFNKGQRDISTGAPDNENGRFESLGWAKSFITRGRIVFKVSWEVGSKKEIELVH